MGIWHRIVTEDLNKEGFEPLPKTSQTYRAVFAQALKAYKYEPFTPADIFAHECAALAESEEGQQYWQMADAHYMSLSARGLGQWLGDISKRM